MGTNLGERKSKDAHKFSRLNPDEIKLMHRFYGIDEKERKKKERDNQRAFYKPLD